MWMFCCQWLQNINIQLEQASEAQRRIEQGATVEKLVLRVGAQA